MKILNKPIEVIAVFAKDKVQPIKFRVIAEDGTEKIVQIQKITVTGKEIIAGEYYMKFTCQVVINGVQKICEIRYQLSNMVWVLWKI